MAVVRAFLAAAQDIGTKLTVSDRCCDGRMIQTRTVLLRFSPTTDCSINGQYLGKTYCFGSAEAMNEFMRNPKDNLVKAQTYYTSKHPG